jgi:hypothetical protein
MRALLNDYQVSTIVQMATAAPVSVNISGGSASFGGIGFGGFDLEGDGTFTFRLPGTTIGSFGHDIDADGIRKLVALYNAQYPAPQNTLLLSQRAGTAISSAPRSFYRVAWTNSLFGDSFITHDLRVTRIIRIRENIRLNLIAEGFNIFNVANLTGFSGTLDQYVDLRDRHRVGTRFQLWSAHWPGQSDFWLGRTACIQIAARLAF